MLRYSRGEIVDCKKLYITIQRLFAELCNFLVSVQAGFLQVCLALTMQSRRDLCAFCGHGFFNEDRRPYLMSLE